MVSGEQIEEYCGVCDHYRGTKPCVISGGDNITQQIYVDQGWCGRARIRGVKVDINSDSIVFRGEEFCRGSVQLEEALRASESFNW